MKHFVKIMNSFHSLTIYAKHSILDFASSKMFDRILNAPPDTLCITKLAVKTLEQGSAPLGP